MFFKYNRRNLLYTSNIILVSLILNASSTTKRMFFTQPLCLSSHNENTFTKGSTNGQIENMKMALYCKNIFWQCISLKGMTKGYFFYGSKVFIYLSLILFHKFYKILSSYFKKTCFKKYKHSFK